MTEQDEIIKDLELVVRILKENRVRLEDEVQTCKSALSAALARELQYRSALKLIASGPRPDGTYNQCREACQKLAEKTLKKVKPL